METLYLPTDSVFKDDEDASSENNKIIAKLLLIISVFNRYKVYIEYDYYSTYKK